MGISIDGGDPEHRRHARIATASQGIASVTSDEHSCRCNKDGAESSSSRGADNGKTCASDETLSCTMDVDFQTTSAGDAKLEIIDEQGTVIDRFVVRVRPALRIEVIVSAAKEEVALGKDGVYEVHQ